MYLFSYILFLLFNEFWSCFTGTVFPCFRFPGGGPCLPSAYEKQLTPRIDQWLRVEQTGKLKHPVFFVLQNLFQLAIGMIFYSKLIVSIRWFQFSWFGKWLLHQTSNSILGFFRGSRYSTMRIETVEHDLFWVWDIHLKRTGPEEHGFFFGGKSMFRPKFPVAGRFSATAKSRKKWGVSEEICFQCSPASPSKRFPLWMRFQFQISLEQTY